MKTFNYSFVWLPAMLFMLTACQKTPMPTPSVDPEPNNDRKSLVALFEATGGEQWTRKQGWNTSLHLASGRVS